MTILKKHLWLIFFGIAFLSLSVYFFVQRQKTSETAVNPKTTQQAHSGLQQDGKQHDEPRSPQKTPSQTGRNDKGKRTTQSEPQMANSQLHFDDVNIPLTPEQVVAYTTLINQYEKDATALEALLETVLIEQKTISAEHQKFTERNLEYLKAQNAIGAEYAAGHLTFDELDAQHEALDQAYPDVVEFGRILVKDGVKAAVQWHPKHIEERRQALKQRTEQLRELDASVQQRKPAVARARRVLEAHINAK